MEKVKLNKHKIKFLLYVFLVVISAGCSTTINQNFITNTLGLNVKVKEKIFSSEDAINPQGEGFTIQTMTFDFKEGDSLFVTNEKYPKIYDLRKDWDVSAWQKTPFVKKDILELIFKYKITDAGMNNQLEMIKQLLDSKENYISYYYKQNDGYIYAIDVSILDVKNKKIYFCEIIT